MKKNFQLGIIFTLAASLIDASYFIYLEKVNYNYFKLVLVNSYNYFLYIEIRKYWRGIRNLNRTDCINWYHLVFIRIIIHNGNSLKYKEFNILKLLRIV
jgi:hypothetical protein